MEQSCVTILSKYLQDKKSADIEMYMYIWILLVQLAGAWKAFSRRQCSRLNADLDRRRQQLLVDHSAP